MLEAVDLRCERGTRTLFRSLGFRLRGGELLRVAGANGTGKTSLLRIVCGLLAPAQGEVRWRGQDIRALREEFWSQLVHIGHANAIKDDLTAAENLAVSCTLGGLSAGDAQVRAPVAVDVEHREIRDDAGGGQAGGQADVLQHAASHGHTQAYSHKNQGKPCKKKLCEQNGRG